MTHRPRIANEPAASEPGLKRLGPDAPRRLAKNVSLREIDPRIFDRTFTIEQRRSFLAAVKRQQRGVPR
jgi:hypothetical protein